MIVISKKRITFVVTCIFVGIFAFLVKGDYLKTETVPTVSLPVTNKVIVIDARTWKTR